MNKTATKVIALLLVLASNSFAQKYMAQDGHLLDANNRVGSMGWNSGGSIDALSNRNNNIMTGNISGGLSFQGAMPYGSPMQFQGLTNTNVLSNFRRDSVNVNRLGSGVSSPSLYVDPGSGVAGGFGNNTILNPQSDYRISTILNPRIQSRSFGNTFNNSLAEGQVAYGSTGSARTLLPTGLSIVSNTGAGGDNPLSVKAALNARLTPRLNTKALDYQSALTVTALAGDPITNSGDMERDLYFPTENSGRIFSPDEQSPGITTTTQQGTMAQFRKQYETWRDAGLESLKDGRYYKAIDNFGQAAIYAQDKDTDTLIYRTIARFAAGEYIGASLDLRRAFLVSFEKTASSELDPEELIKDDQVVRTGLKDLERCYELTGNDSLLFLMAYLEYLAGDVTHARVLMEKLTEQVSDNELYNRFQDSLPDQR